MTHTELIFKENETPFTLGVEVELQLIDKTSLELTPRAPQLLDDLNHPRLTKELFQSMLEVITGVHTDAHGATADLLESFRDIEAYTEANNIWLSSTGNHPTADYNDRVITDSPRYHYLIDRNKWLSRRTAVFGMHVHIGMRNGDDCIAFSNFMLRQLPMLVALTASSPFWQGRDSGLATTRPTVYEAIPTCGLPYLVGSWDEFLHRYNQLIAVKSIESMKDLWWDLRPSPGFGTLEIRICDGPATMMELQCVVAFIHMLALWYEDHQEEFAQNHPLISERWILRENKWRSIRHGLEALFIEEHTVSNIPIRDLIAQWMGKLQPYATKYNYTACMEGIKAICDHGNSTTRQRAMLEKTGSLTEVTRFNIDEFYRREPIWD